MSFCRFDISLFSLLFFFFNDTPTTEIYTLSLHDALPIFSSCSGLPPDRERLGLVRQGDGLSPRHRAAEKLLDRKSTRLNSSHANISYAVFCLKKKNNNAIYTPAVNNNHTDNDTPTAPPIL